MILTTSPVDFVSLLPSIRKHARIQFCRLSYEARQEAIAETVARAFVFYQRLVEQGKFDLIAATPLADYAARQVRAGRRVGTCANVHDVSGLLCQRKHQLTISRLSEFDEGSEEWEEVLVEDRRTTPAEIAVARIDFRTWLGQLPGRLRQIAEVLATGESTGDASRRFGVSMGRISQLRTELRNAWLAFQGEGAAAVLGAA